MNQGFAAPIARKRINLTTGFANAINLPRYKSKDGDFQLYPHGEGSKVVLNRPQGWYKEAEHTYNSPSNVRAVCLSVDGANVLYWAPYIKNSKVALLELAGDYVFDKTAKEGGRQRLNQMQYMWDNAGLQALVSPVVLSNIEELWISAELLACPKYGKYYQQLRGLKPGQVAEAPYLVAILENEISTASKRRTIADTFPLLRAIVVVQTVPDSPVQDFHKCAVRTDEVKKFLESKFPNQRRAIGECRELMLNIAKQTGFGFAICPVSTGNILKFSLGDYKYDQKVLSGVKDKLLQKYTGRAAATGSEMADTVKDVMGEEVKAVSEKQTASNSVVSSVEEFLNKLVAEGKSESRLNLLLSAYKAEYGEDSLQKEFERFTAEGKKRYGKFFN